MDKLTISIDVLDAEFCSRCERLSICGTTLPKWFFENTKQFKRRACICGTKTAPALEIVPSGPVQYYLRCPSCGRIGKTSITTRGALINWNTRQLED